MKTRYTVLWKRYLWILFHLRLVSRWLSEAKDLVRYENDPRTVKNNMTRPAADAIMLYGRMYDNRYFWKLWNTRVLYYKGEK